MSFNVSSWNERGCRKFNLLGSRGHAKTDPRLEKWQETTRNKSTSICRRKKRRRRLDVQVAGHVGPGQGVQRDERRISVQLIDFSKRLEKLKTNQQPKLPRDCSGVFLEVARKKTNPWFWMKIKKRSSSFSFSICVHCLHWREKHETVKKTGLSWKHKIIFYRIGGCMSTPS